MKDVHLMSIIINSSKKYDKISRQRKKGEDGGLLFFLYLLISKLSIYEKINYKFIFRPKWDYFYETFMWINMYANTLFCLNYECIQT